MCCCYVRLPALTCANMECPYSSESGRLTSFRIVFIPHAADRWLGRKALLGRYARERAVDESCVGAS